MISTVGLNRPFSLTKNNMNRFKISYIQCVVSIIVKIDPGIDGDRISTSLSSEFKWTIENVIFTHVNEFILSVEQI